MSDAPVTQQGQPMHELDPLMREALGWVVLLRSGDVTTDDLGEIRHWRAQSADHEAAFREAALLWRDLKASADTVRHERRPETRTMTRRMFAGGAVAASAAAAAYMLYEPPLELWPSIKELAADYRTGKGERRDIALADGIALTLNTQTSIAVRGADKGTPEIDLIAGEAAITATGVPLVVRATGARIAAERASFNTRCIGDRVSVACLDGEVEVGYGGKTVQLAKGQGVDFSPADGLGVPVSEETADAAAWRQGLLIIRDRRLADVVEEVNRYRPGRIIVTNGDLGRRVVNGTFHIDSLDDFAGQVRQLFGANVRSLPGGVVLLS
jgi:transmembrane sensor